MDNAIAWIWGATSIIAEIKSQYQPLQTDNIKVFSVFHACYYARQNAHSMVTIVTNVLNIEEISYEWIGNMQIFQVLFDMPSCEVLR